MSAASFVDINRSTGAVTVVAAAVEELVAGGHQVEVGEVLGRVGQRRLHSATGPATGWGFTAIVGQDPSLDGSRLYTSADAAAESCAAQVLHGPGRRAERDLAQPLPLGPIPA